MSPVIVTQAIHLNVLRPAGLHSRRYHRNT